MNAVKQVLLGVTVWGLILLVGYQCVVSHIRNSNDAREFREYLEQASDRSLQSVYDLSPEEAEAAIALYTKAIAADPDNDRIAAAYLGRAKAYYEIDLYLYFNLDYFTREKLSDWPPLYKENYDKALADYTKAKELASWVGLGKSGFQFAMEDWPEERQSYSGTSEFISVPSGKANEHIGEIIEVCGLVASTRYAPTSKGAPTWLNFDYPYPSHTFTVIIWGSDRSAFPTNPERYYENETVCATGVVESYQGEPQIVGTSANQLEIR